MKRRGFNFYFVIAVLGALGLEMVAAPAAHAYILSTLESPANKGMAIDYSIPTHLIVVGHGDKSEKSKIISNLFLPASMGRAFRYRELFPRHQIVFLTTREHNSDLDTQHLKRWGLKVQWIEAEPLSGANTLWIADQFRQIVSLDFYGHSSVMWGIGLETDADRMTMRLDGLSRLRDNFYRPGAFVSINGCNSGFYLAPTLAQIWNVPVMGSFTGTDYQQLHENGGWYFNNPGQYPPPASVAKAIPVSEEELLSNPQPLPPAPKVSVWAKANKGSYDTPVPCSGAHGCVRMKPSLGGYYGMWSPPQGFSAGLNIYKFFCPGYQEGVKYGAAYENCMSAVAQAFISFPSVNPIRYESPEELIQENLIDYLCPSASSKSDRPSASLRLPRPNGLGFDPIAPETPVDARDRCAKALLDSRRNGNLIYDAEWKSKNTIECSTEISPETNSYAGIYALVGGVVNKTTTTGGLFSRKKTTTARVIQNPVYKGCDFEFSCGLQSNPATGQISILKNSCDVTSVSDQSQPQTFLKEYRLILEAMQFMRSRYYSAYRSHR